jgi:hypothetical protein
VICTSSPLKNALGGAPKLAATEIKVSVSDVRGHERETALMH